jgi:hypothetical protein
MRKRPNQLPPGNAIFLSFFSLLLLMCGSVSPVWAQTAHVLTGAGLKKLDSFVGTWKAEATDSANKGKISAVNTIRWSSNEGFLIADQNVTIGGGTTNNLSIYSYDAATDSYMLTIVGVPGRAPFTVPIAYQGDTLVYHSAYTDGGQRFYNRTLNIFHSAEEYVYLVQSSSDSLHWETHGEGRSVKVARK